MVMYDVWCAADQLALKNNHHRLATPWQLDGSHASFAMEEHLHVSIAGTYMNTAVLSTAEQLMEAETMPLTAALLPKYLNLASGN